MTALVDDAIAELEPLIGTRAACRATGRAQANHYRWHRQSPKPTVTARRARRPSPRALDQRERDSVRALLNSPGFVDKAPAAVYHELLGEGVYLCSVSSMYRILRAHGEVRERRAQAAHPARVKPELLATKPNQVWSWDITKLHGSVKWSYHYLYVIIDIYSRYVVGWMIAERESAALAEKFLADTVVKQDVDRDTLTIHADNGSSMASKPVAFLLADLGVTKTHSRPHVSNDNPYSEAQFKTSKYRPDFPQRFGSLQDARTFCKTFMAWYNDEYRRSGIGYHTPSDVHHRQAGDVREARAEVLAAACTRNPERFVRKHPEPPALPEPASINQPPAQETSTEHQPPSKIS
ncbi:IS3 family transposase [Micromonospora sp. NPDC005087]|uniref:IS3 family transposase n=1 Tax=Micromonospora sp. NPDC005087 TaxID=3364225 RepID=UPI0036BA6F3F